MSAARGELAEGDEGRGSFMVTAADVTAKVGGEAE